MVLLYVIFWACLALLISFAVALLLDLRGFREFALHPSPQGSASVGGLFTIRAGVLLLLTAAITAGATSPLWHSGFLSGRGEDRTVDPQLEGRVEEFEERVKHLGSPAGVLETVASWGRDEAEEGRRLNEMRCERSGPWTRPESEPLLASVPGSREEGSAAGCPEHYRTRLELFGGQEAVEVDVMTLMYSAPNCRELTPVDLMLSCPDAHRLYGSTVLTCDGLEPRWTRGGVEMLTVQAVEVERGCEPESDLNAR